MTCQPSAGTRELGESDMVSYLSLVLAEMRALTMGASFSESSSKMERAQGSMSPLA